MKRKFFVFFLMCYASYVTSQIDANSVFVLPALSNAEMQSITTVSQGGLVYNSTDGRLYKYTGSQWIPIGLGASLDEDLKFIRGNVNENGTIAQGTGFTVKKLTNSRYQIDFLLPFKAVPSITFTAGELTALNSYEDNVVNIISLSNSRATVIIHDNEGENNVEDFWFSFIAVGPR